MEEMNRIRRSGHNIFTKLNAFVVPTRLFPGTGTCRPPSDRWLWGEHHPRCGQRSDVYLRQPAAHHVQKLAHILQVGHTRLVSSMRF